MTEKLETYDFAHAVQEAYSFFWRDLCDWYLEIVKPRLYDGEEEVSATLLYALERVLGLLHPTMPFVTRGDLELPPGAAGATWRCTRSRPPTPSLIDEAAEADVEGGIGLTQRLRAWRDLAGVPVGATLPAVIDGVEPPAFVSRLSRFEFDGVGAEPVASIGPVRVLDSDQLDAAAVAERLEKRREELRAEVERGERKLGNEGFVAKAPAEVVEEERGKLERYRAELAELS